MRKREKKGASIRDLIKLLIAPLVLLLSLVLLIIAYNFFNLPDLDKFVELAQKYYSRHLFWTVFIGALVEGLLVVNWYLPGSIVIVFGVIFARNNVVDVALSVTLIILGFFMTTIINYGLGRYGWYRLLLRLGLKEPLQRMKKRVEKSGLPIIFSTYFHPNVGALTATSAGILMYSFRRFVFYSFFALVGWNALWGIVVYFTGPIILNLLSIWTAFLVIIFWIIFLVIKHYKNHKAGPINIP